MSLGVVWFLVGVFRVLRVEIVSPTMVLVVLGFLAVALVLMVVAFLFNLFPRV